jgi:6-phosphogluconolactonase (cycloisomerase 2 family)
MRIRFIWLAAILILISLALLMACSAKYSQNYNGLIVVPTQGLAVMQSFSLDLGNGHIQTINNPNGPPTPGIPTSVILDPAGQFAYVIVYQNPALTGGSITGIATFSIASDGKLSNVGTTAVPNPTAMAMDSGGKYLFVATSEGTVYVFAIGSNASLKAVGNPTSVAIEPGGATPSVSALAVTPTVYPPQFAYCSGVTPPTTENLYVADKVNYALLNYSISSSGDLTLVPYNSISPGIPTGTVPSGVAVDPCNRFVYVSNSAPNNSVSAYKICYAVSLNTNCPVANFSLQEITGSPYPAGDDPGPLLVDPYGKFLYVVDTESNAISGYQISGVMGTLTAFTGALIATNVEPTAIAIRSDDSWMFVSNLNSANISEYAISLSNGGLTPQPPISTFNYPSGVAVK